MTQVTDLASPIRPPLDRWNGGPEAASDELDALVYRSNLLGADRALANQGGGNTSVKAVSTDHMGRPVDVLWVKASGTDLASITRAGFAALRLEEVLPLRQRTEMPDAEMVEYLRRCALSPDQPRPSIETLLHAFIGAPHVDHTHPDAVIALTATPDGRRLAEETYEDEAVWLDYERPGFDMSRRIAELLEANPNACPVLLAKHGLVTWGETSEETYRRTIALVSRAVATIDRAGAASFGLGGANAAECGGTEVPSFLQGALPPLRSALLEDADG